MMRLGKNRNGKKNNNNKNRKRPTKNEIQQGLRIFITWLFLFVAIWVLFKNNGKMIETGMPRELGYSEFYDIVKTNASTHKIAAAVKMEDSIHGKFSDGTSFTVTIPADDPDLMRALRENVLKFEVKRPTFLSSLFWAVLPTLVFVGLLWFLFYRGAAQGGGKIFAFGKSRARLITPDMPKVTFLDVAGVDEAKEELKEVIEFLKDPKKFQRLGGKIPKGVLVMGPPGVGKTLLAKAVAGEAGVPFLSISGSDFVEMFVGVGASRVRDLFEQARKSAIASGKGCIIFIDEIDAVGRQRFAGIGGGHDEREQTLNALLVEMDGFDAHQGIILVAASNRPDVLDPALLRPGRFDRQIVIHRPDILGREEILKVHTKNIKIAKEVNLKNIARQTSGFSGADLANLCNEAALLAARKNKDAVDMQDMEAAIERVIMGPEKKSRVISKRDKETAAWHESGHALLSLLIPEVDPMTKVSIIPRGLAGGYTLIPPAEDQQHYTKKELLAEITVSLGGRASEDLNFQEVTTGAQHDLEVATNIARKMVCEYGMSDKLGNLTLGRRHGQIFLGRDFYEEERNYSEHTAQQIDAEVKSIIESSFKRAKDLLSENKDKLNNLAVALLEKEVLDGEEAKKIVGITKSAKDATNRKA
jgi:cell division protease FtsH